MLDVHVASIEAAIHGCAVVVAHSVNAVQQSPSTAYVEGEVAFVDGSRLAFFEFLRSTLADLDREKYRYQFMDADNLLVFRYDNALHHRNIATFPHHRHELNDVTNSLAPSFAEVLLEIEAYVMGVP